MLVPFLFPSSIGNIAEGTQAVNLTPGLVTLGILSPTSKRDDDDPELPLPNISDRDF